MCSSLYPEPPFALSYIAIMFIRRSLCPRDQCECFSLIGMRMVSSVVMSRFFVFLLFKVVQVSLGLFVVALSDALIQRTRWFPFIALMAVWFRKASIILSFRNLAVVSTIVALFCRCPLVSIAASIRETLSCPLRMTCCILCALCVQSHYTATLLQYKSFIPTSTYWITVQYCWRGYVVSIRY